jgi:cytidylate kinase
MDIQKSQNGMQLALQRPGSAIAITRSIAMPMPAITPADTQANAQENAQTGLQANAIASEADARAVAAELLTLMAELRETVQQEVELVCSGRLITAGRVARRKSELARAFVTNVARVRANRHYLAREKPELLRVLLQQHGQFRTRLRHDLARLNAARAVSAGILRSLSNELRQWETEHADGAEHVAIRKAA